MVARRTRALVVAAALLLAAAAPGGALAHPLHTTLTELTYDPAARAVRLSVRVFADDFSASVIHGRAAAPDAPIVVPPDSAMVRYLVGKLVLADRSGRLIPLRWCGTRRAAEVLFLCLRAPVASPPRGARLRNAVLTELFADQVNVVRAAVGGAAQTLLFTPGDGMKALR